MARLSSSLSSTGCGECSSCFTGNIFSMSFFSISYASSHWMSGGILGGVGPRQNLFAFHSLSASISVESKKSLQYLVFAFLYAFLHTFLASLASFVNSPLGLSRHSL